MDEARLSPARQAPLIRVHSGAEALARLAALGSPMTAFQGAGFLGCLLGATGEIDGFRLVEIHDGANGLALPLGISTKAGLRIADIAGGKQASFHAPLRLGEGDLPLASLRAGLLKAGREIGLDLFAFTDMPRFWLGVANPLAALPGDPAPHDGWQVSIDTDAETLIARLSDREERKKFRYRTRKLEERGAITARWAASPAEAREWLDRLLDWKARQFLQSGVTDPFAEPSIRRFLADSVGSEASLLRVFALETGGQPVAILAGMSHPFQFSGMITAYDPDPEIARASPGQVMLTHLLRALADGGYRHFDLGVGDARYKAHFCPERIALVDCVLPVSLRGKVAAPLWRQFRRIKGRIKRDPRLMALAMAARRRLRRG